jgi:hypothetical protein
MKVHLENAGQPKTLTFAQSAAQAGQWRLVHTKFEIDESIDPAIVRDIHVFDPCYVPLRVEKVYQTPAGTTERRSYAVIGRYIPNPQEGYENAAVQLDRVPVGFKFDRTKIHELRTLWVPWPGPDADTPASVEWKLGYPPAEVKVGRWLVDQLAAVQKFFDVGIELDKEGNQIGTTGQSTLRRMGEILEIQEKKEKERCDKAMAEARAAMREDWRFFKKAIDEGRWGPDPQEPKAYLDLGAKS